MSLPRLPTKTYSFLSLVFSPPRRLQPSPTHSARRWHCSRVTPRQLAEFPRARPRHELRGSLFAGGPCARRPIRDFSMAASSVIAVDDEGDSVAEFRAPVWAPLSPDPPRRRSQVFHMGGRFAYDSIGAYSDCGNVVKPARRLRVKHLSGKRVVLGLSCRCSREAPGQLFGR